jgi:hypothetical protein
LASLGLLKFNHLYTGIRLAIKRTIFTEFTHVNGQTLDELIEVAVRSGGNGESLDELFAGLPSASGGAAALSSASGGAKAKSSTFSSSVYHNSLLLDHLSKIFTLHAETVKVVRCDNAYLSMEKKQPWNHLISIN